MKETITLAGPGLLSEGGVQISATPRSRRDIKVAVLSV